MIRRVQNQGATGREADSYILASDPVDQTPAPALFTEAEWSKGVERAEKNPEDLGLVVPMELQDLAAWVGEETESGEISDAMKRVLGLAGGLGGLRKPPAPGADTPPPAITNPTASFTWASTYGTSSSTLVLTDTTVVGSSPIVARTWTIIRPDGTQVLPAPAVSPYTLLGLGSDTGGEVIGLKVSLSVIAEDGGSDVSAEQIIDIVAPASGSGVVAFMTYKGGADWADATPSERWLRDQIQSWGYTLRKIEDGQWASDVMVGDEVAVIISSSVAAGTAGGWWTGRGWSTLPVPMLIMDRFVPQLEGLAPAVDAYKIATVERSPLLSPASTLAPGSQTLLLSPQEMGILREFSPHAQVLFHVVGDHSQPVVAIQERGEPMASGQAPARIAYWTACRETVYDSINTTGLQVLRELLDWCVADPGMTQVGPVALFNVTQSYSTDTQKSIFHAVDASTAPAGRTISQRLWVLRDAAGDQLDAVNGSSYDTAPIPDGQFHQLDLTVTDSAGVSRTKRMALYAEAPFPVAGFTQSVVDGSPSANRINASDTSRSPNRITEYDWTLFQSDGVTVVDQVVGGGTIYNSPDLVDGTYVLQHRVENVAGLPDTTSSTIIVPNPPVTVNVDVNCVGTRIFAYNKTQPPVGVTITSTDWDFNLANPGTLTASGLHPGLGLRGSKPVAPGIGSYNGQVTITMSNGSVTVKTFIYTSWLEKTWGDRGSQNYVTPEPTGIFARTLYFDAVSGNNNNPGTETQPKQTISHLSAILTAGDRIYLKGDFGSASLDAEDLAGSPTVNTLITRWPGAAERPKLQATPTLAAIMLRNSSYVWVEDVDMNGTAPDGTMKWCILGEQGSVHHNVIRHCGISGGGAGLRLEATDTWVDGCNVDLVGSFEQNGGNGIQFEGWSADCTIVRNTVLRCGHGGLELLLSSGTPGRQYRMRVAHNIIANTWAGSMGVAGAVNCLFEENQIHDIGSDPIIINPDTGRPYKSIGSRVGINERGDCHTFRYNRVWFTARTAFQAQSNINSGLQITRHNHSYHNTYYLCGYSEGLNYTMSLAMLDGDGGDGIYFEDNLWENENFVDNHSFANGALPSAIRILVNDQTNWVKNTMWGPPGGAPLNHLAGNVVRHTNITDSSGVMQKWMVYQSSGSKYYTLPEIGLNFPQWINNLQSEPNFLSTDPADPDFLVLDPASPLASAGVPVEGITYAGGVVPVGWYPES